MTERFRNLRRTVLLVAVGALAVGAAAWGSVAAATTLTPGISLTAGALILACGLTYLLVRRSHAAHDRAIRHTYPSFAPALARRRAEAQSGV